MANRDFTIVLDKRDLAIVNAWLNQMEKVDQSNTIQSALKQGVSMIQTAGKINLASRNKTVSGNLKKSFAIRVVKKKAYALAGFRRSAPKKGIKGGNHAHLVDRGTVKRWTKKPYTDKLGRTYPAGMYRGSVSKGSPKTGTLFWTSAVESTGYAAQERLMTAIYKALEEINNRKIK